VHSLLFAVLVRQFSQNISNSESDPYTDLSESGVQRVLSLGMVTSEAPVVPVYSSRWPSDQITLDWTCAGLLVCTELLKLSPEATSR
jgi:hypothetical protein